ncbi:protein transport protein SEC31-like isoform X2 [Dysidea avara]
MYYYNRKTDESQWEKPKGYVKRLKPDSHSKGESKSHSRSLDVHSKSSDVHSKPVDSHSKSLNSHSKPLDSHSDRKHGYQSGTPNKYHRDHRRGSSSDHRSGTNAHRSSSHEKRAAEHGTPKESYHHHHQHKASRTPQKLSTGSEPFCSPIQQERSIPCSSPILQQQQQLRPLMMPSTPGQQQLPNFQPHQPPQFMSPQQQHPPVMLQHHQPQPNGPPEGIMNVHPYQPWNPTQLPPMHSREQGGYPPGMMATPLLSTMFSPHSGGGGPSVHGDYHVPPQQYPPASMDTLSQGLHPLQQAFILQNQQHHHHHHHHHHNQLMTPMSTPVGTPLNTPNKPHLQDIGLPPLPSKSAPHTPTLHSHSNPSTPHIQKPGGAMPYQLFSEHRLSFERTHSLPAASSSKDLMEQFQAESRHNVLQSEHPNNVGSGSISDVRSSQEEESEQQKIQIGLDYFNKPLTEFWLTSAHDSIEKQLGQSAVDSLTHKHLEGPRLTLLVKKNSLGSSVKHLRCFVRKQRVEGVRKMVEKFRNKR